MLDLWRPPQGAGDPLGCLATTYTFAPGLFDEQCLARFLEIESEPNREDLAFLLERESRLGSVYAGVLVDQIYAGVEHSLRWDVLPVRIRAGKQHAKLSLLAWSHHIRVIVASANLTEPGYRTNHEVAAAIDLKADGADTAALNDAVAFLRSLIRLVPAAADRPPEVQRAEAFLERVERQVKAWRAPRRGAALRQQLVFTLPADGGGRPARSSLMEAVQACRARGGSPSEAWIASPFFDVDDDTSRVTASLCKLMARGGTRHIWFAVPAIHDENTAAVPRLAAPKALIRTPHAYHGVAHVETLPDHDGDKNRRPWHAKMLGLRTNKYSALMVGSSNFTCAGMGVTGHRNAEANLLTVASKLAYGRDVRRLEGVWPEMEEVDDPESAEWLGAPPDDGDGDPPASLLPAGFLSASYRAGDERQVILRLDPPHLPEDWSVHTCGRDGGELLSASTWLAKGSPATVARTWKPVQPPEKVLVRWADHEAFLPLNVEDGRKLPPPERLEHMSADDMLSILAASDPSAAFRAWAKRQHPSDGFDPELDSATPIDLDPLRRYDLQATFLHRIRRRARVLAQLRANLQRPVWSRQALEWRLKGLVGIEPLADRLVSEVIDTDGAIDEGLLTLADFLIVLRGVEYEPHDGSLSKREFEKVLRPFLKELADKLRRQIGAHRNRLSEDVMQFWDRVVDRCQG